MTLEEKASQMYDKAPAIPRLGIPEYNWWNEALHGVARAGEATVFPQAIGLAATFDEPLMLDIATAIAAEGRAKHHAFLGDDVRAMYTGLTYWSPNINIFRDPRWGRGQETYGEDPFLTGRMAVNFVRGLQGDDPEDLKSVATVKHYAVHSGPEGSRHSDNYDASDQDLYETYLPAFRMAVEEAGVQSVMCAYNAFRGTPACGSELLLDIILREELGFDGYVVSDCGAVGDIYYDTAHAEVGTAAEAAAMAVRAGTDLNCGDDKGSKYAALPEAVERGLITEDEIDMALTRLMRARYQLGLLGEGSLHADVPISVVGNADHRALALQAARQSHVLLKNEGLLPLPADTRIALIGPNADSEMILVGNYSGIPIDPVTPLAALRARLGESNVRYAPGSSLVADFYNHAVTVPPSAFPDGLDVTWSNGTETRKARADNIDSFELRSPLDGTIGTPLQVRWEGALVVPETGTYRFQGSDFVGGVTPRIDGADVPGEGIRLVAGERYAFSAISDVKETWWANAIHPTLRLRWLNADRDLQAEALAAAQDADVIVFVGGLTAGLEGEEMPLSFPGFDKGDRTDIDLPDTQDALLRALHATGKPLVHVNYSGSALALNFSDVNVPAIIQGFYPGEATGTALAEILFGDTNPSGRLPVTFYRGVDDLPGFKSYDMAGRTYKYYEGEVLYPFGYGLSYTEFDYSDVDAGVDGDAVALAVTVANAGEAEGADIAQVYAQWTDAVSGVPNVELVAFERVTLPDGKAERVGLRIPVERLHYIDASGQTRVPSGPVRLSVGSGQPGHADNVQTVSITLPQEGDR